jgi:hypothetical protein
MVIIGQSLDKEFITQALNDCLLSDEEMRQGQDVWNRMCMDAGDPFQDDWYASIEAAQSAKHQHNDDHSNYGHAHEHDHDKNCGQ